MPFPSLHAPCPSRPCQKDLYNEWRPFYIDYNLLKRELKVRTHPHTTLKCALTPFFSQARTTSRNWTDDDEREFTRMLERELDKIHHFQKTKVRPLSLSRARLVSHAHPHRTPCRRLSSPVA